MFLGDVLQIYEKTDVGLFLKLGLDSLGVVLTSVSGDFGDESSAEIFLGICTEQDYRECFVDHSQLKTLSKHEWLSTTQKSIW